MTLQETIKALRDAAKKADTPRHAAILESRARMLESGGAATKYIKTWLADAEQWTNRD